MTDEELREARQRNITAIENLERIGLAGGKGGQLMESAKIWFEDADIKIGEVLTGRQRSGR